ncbi:GNAT family N-acetyltransferase [Actinophytocola glycyrrhizae]|uniref:GNAT family N-acetyltransferase n=1 Tax=Actinophytocola glycyrrhizae TaxID=2044873 RepID=A0ABV9SD97_9PSEU
MRLRPARPGEAALLSALALRSKGHWGYDDAFLAACRDELTIAEGEVAARRTTVAELDGTVVGMYTLDGGPPAAELGQMFVDPGHIGRGVGRALWTHAVECARAAGIHTLTIDADPFAEAFYLAMGATRTGSVPSGSVPERELPRLTFSTSGG